jgi:hypothetical protein
MKSLFHKIIAIVLLVVVTTTQVLFAADVSNFVIQVSPNPMKP